MTNDTKKQHLYIIDARFIGYKKNTLIKLIDSILGKASKILIFYAKGKRNIGKNLALLVDENSNFYKKITVLNSMNISEGTTYKNSKFSSSNAREKNKIFVKKKDTPSLSEIKEMRNIQSKKDNLLVWDIENVSYRKIDKILQKVYKNGDIIIVSVEPLSKNTTQILFPYVLLYGIKIFNDHTDSDIKIEEIVDQMYSDYKSVSIVSSDTDFVPLVNRVLSKGLIVQMLLNDIQNRRMLQILKIDHVCLRINTL